MKTKYLISALIAGAVGSGAALADTYNTTGSSSYDDYKTRGEVKSEASRDMRQNGAGTGDGYSREQLHDAGQGGSGEDNRGYMTREEMRESQMTSINAGTISIGDGTAYP